MTKTEPEILSLWSDEPAVTDLLSFAAIADTVVDAIFDERLDPVALGVSGSWGSGKTTVLNLIESQIQVRNRGAGGSRALVIRADPWRYDPSVGPKESLISEVLSGLAAEIKEADPVGEVAGGALKKLIKRVNWSKAMKVAAKTAITLQLPSLDDLTGLVSDEPESLDSEKGMSAFRAEFKAFLKSSALQHVSQVVVLVDDLDRCLPATVVETLETIRLFLSVEGMSFVIAADESRVAEAIQQKLQSPAPESGKESVADLYLHKIVQTTVPVPALSYFDTRSYLFLLLVQSEVEETVYKDLVGKCAQLRLTAGSLDEITLPTETDLSFHAATASRLTPILYEKFVGNPRRIKRFLNDLHVRRSIASRRGIALEPDAIAKLMVLEKLLEPDFAEVLSWLAAGALTTQFESLEKLANSGESDLQPDPKQGKPKVVPSGTEFTVSMVRWAKLPPQLDAASISGYLTLAASFKGKLLVDEALPEDLRDIAAGLVSSSQIDRSAVTKEALQRLSHPNVVQLLQHLGRRMQDDPSLQSRAVNAIITLADLHPRASNEVTAALLKLPSAEITPPTVLVFTDRYTAYSEILETWKKGSPDRTRKAIESVAKAGKS